MNDLIAKIIVALIEAIFGKAQIAVQEEKKNEAAVQAQHNNSLDDAAVVDKLRHSYSRD